MATKLTRQTQKIAIQLHLVAKSCIVCSSRYRRASPETFGYTLVHNWNRQKTTQHPTFSTQIYCELQ